MYTEEQQKAADSIQAGKSVAIFGRGGSGKTYLLRKELPKLKNVAVVAPTGSAAVNIGFGATTVHRLFGLKPEIQNPHKRNNKLRPTVAKVLKRIDVLVVEEVGMVRMDIFEAMDYSMRKAKNSDQPFGGIQVILLGDVRQFTPIVSQYEMSAYNRLYHSEWFFNSESFAHFDKHLFVTNNRNKNAQQDKIMMSIVNDDKWAGLAIQRLIELAKPYNPDSGDIHLCAYNADADRINNQKLAQNRNKSHTYIAIDKGEKRHQKDFPVPAVVELKVDLRVMIVANEPSGAYVNGDTGVVVQCEKDCVMVKLDRTDGVVLVTAAEWDVNKYEADDKGLKVKSISKRTQMPIKIGYAMSIHKMQGQTLESATINLGAVTRAKNGLYVAISRVKDLKNLSFTRPPRVNDIIVDRESLRFMAELEKTLDK